MWQSTALKYFVTTDEIATAQLIHLILKYLFACLAMTESIDHIIAFEPAREQ
jgi:hypothetical protein